MVLHKVLHINLQNQQKIKKTNPKNVNDLIKLSENEIKKIIDEFDENITILPIRDGIIIPKDLYNESDKFDFKDIDFIKRISTIVQP